MRLIIPFLFSIFLAWPAAAADDENVSLAHYRPKHVLTLDGGSDRLTLKSKIAELSSKGFDIAGVNLDRNTFDVVVTAEELKKLVDNYTVLSFQTAPFGPDADYKNPKEVESTLRNITDKYPDLAQLVVVGETTEKRKIYAINLTANRRNRILAKKPVVYINAMHHAREVMTTEVALGIIDELSSQYGKDDRITSILESVDIWVIPQVNPDGNNKVWLGETMWRKNTRGGYGVDLNRNYPYKWGSCNGSSGATFSDTYRGPSAGSEPETLAVTNFLKALRPKIALSLHSYSEIVLYPYGCDGERAEGEEGKKMREIGANFASKLVKDNGKKGYEHGTPWELLYGVDGGDIDWLYHELGTYSYVVELNSATNGFQPDYRLVGKTIDNVREGWLYLLEEASKMQ